MSGDHRQASRHAAPRLLLTTVFPTLGGGRAILLTCRGSEGGEGTPPGPPAYSCGQELTGQQQPWLLGHLPCRPARTRCGQRSGKQARLESVVRLSLSPWDQPPLPRVSSGSSTGRAASRKSLPVLQQHRCRSPVTHVREKSLAQSFWARRSGSRDSKPGVSFSEAPAFSGRLF